MKRLFQIAGVIISLLMGSINCLEAAGFRRNPSSLRAQKAYRFSEVDRIVESLAANLDERPYLVNLSHIEGIVKLSREAQERIQSSYSLPRGVAWRAGPWVLAGALMHAAGTSGLSLGAPPGALYASGVLMWSLSPLLAIYRTSVATEKHDNKIRQLAYDLENYFWKKMTEKGFAVPENTLTRWAWLRGVLNGEVDIAYYYFSSENLEAEAKRLKAGLENQRDSLTKDAAVHGLYKALLSKLQSILETTRVEPEPEEGVYYSWSEAHYRAVDLLSEVKKTLRLNRDELALEGGEAANFIAGPKPQIWASPEMIQVSEAEALSSRVLGRCQTALKELLHGDTPLEPVNP